MCYYDSGKNETKNIRDTKKIAHYGEVLHMVSY